MESARTLPFSWAILRISIRDGFGMRRLTVLPSSFLATQTLVGTGKITTIFLFCWQGKFPCVVQVQSGARVLCAAKRTLDWFCATCDFDLQQRGKIVIITTGTLLGPLYGRDIGTVSLSLGQYRPSDPCNFVGQGNGDNIAV
jgi:hypothetical protein